MSTCCRKMRYPPHTSYSLVQLQVIAQNYELDFFLAEGEEELITLFEDITQESYQGGCHTGWYLPDHKVILVDKFDKFTGWEVVFWHEMTHHLHELGMPFFVDQTTRRVFRQKIDECSREALLPEFGREWRAYREYLSIPTERGAWVCNWSTTSYIQRVCASGTVPKSRKELARLGLPVSEFKFIN